MPKAQARAQTPRAENTKTHRYERRSHLPLANTLSSEDVCYLSNILTSTLLCVAVPLMHVALINMQVAACQSSLA